LTVSLPVRLRFRRFFGHLSPVIAALGDLRFVSSKRTLSHLPARPLRLDRFSQRKHSTELHRRKLAANMSNSMRDLIDGEAELNDEEDDESFDEEAGEPRERERNNMLDDSSDEDEDDEDEEEARRVRWFPRTPIPEKQR
jgi:hypothetical protein